MTAERICSALAQKIRDTEGQCLVAVVGAGHVEGMKKALLSDQQIDLEALLSRPPGRTHE